MAAGEQHDVLLRGITVQFPFVPYDCQRVYMEKVIECLQDCKNGILESPTGTGKTLCLLCAALAWRDDCLQRQALKQGVTPSQVTSTQDTWDTHGNAGASGFIAPKIIYASRTHSQLSQVMQELKNTAYKPRVAVIGSRDQLCVHPDVIKLDSNSDKVQMCRMKVHQRSCTYYNNLDGPKKDLVEHSARSSVHDIEDLAVLGNRERVCPYYLARELRKTADIVFMPYNYILDIKNRRAHGIDLQGVILIIDEAHNVEKMCEESASFDLTSLDIASCMKDVTQLLKWKEGEKSGMDDSYLQDQGDQDVDQQDIEDLVNLKEFLKNFEQQIDAIELTDKNERQFPGSYIYEVFEKAGVTHQTSEVLMGQCEKTISLLSMISGSKVFHSGSHLQKFLDCLKVVFSQPSFPCDVSDHAKATSANYKVYVKVETKAKQRTDLWTVSAAAKQESRTLSYWCFSPGHSMMDVVRQGVRCIILTSGTLSPIDSFSSELRVDFPVVLQNPHVITREHVWVGVVSRGPDGNSLNSRFANRSTVGYQSSLGNAIVNFARIVPHGLLVFYPSYTLMAECVSRWEENGIMSRLRGIKDVFTEPRRKNEFQATMEAFYSKVHNPENSGAIFMAVCRGKVSEGLDFADNNGRAVVITGLPYPPRLDPKVTLKMEHLKESTNWPGTKALPPEEWYKQQASRAVNQAIGRVIRHRNDYGAILLCDERFCHGDNRSQLPKWLQPHLRVYSQFGMAQRELNLFIKKAEEKFGSIIQQPKAAIEQLKKELTTAEGSTTGHIAYKPKGKRLTSGDGVLPLKAASEVDIHVASRATAAAPVLPGALLPMKLKFSSDSGDKSASFFEALAESKVIPLFPPAISCRTEACVDVGGAGSLSDSILGKRPAAVLCVTDGPSSSSQQGQGGGDASSVQPAAKLVIKGPDAKRLKTESYLSSLKQALSEESFVAFKSLLQAYSKERNFGELKQALSEVFGTPSLHELLRGFVRYVRKEHKDAFNEFCFAFTGKKCEGQTQLEGLTYQTGHEQLSGAQSVGGAVKWTKPTLLPSKTDVKTSNTVLLPSSVTLSVDTSADSSSRPSDLSTPLLTTGTHLNSVPGSGGAPAFPLAKPALKSRVSGKICAQCSKQAQGPHEAKCGHVCCYECWIDRLKSSEKTCPKCGKGIRKREFSRVYLN